jgi:PST family polysaccharide transporter
MTLVLLGAKWERVSVILAGFTILAVYTPLAYAANWLLTSQGRGKDIWYQSLIASVLTAASFVAGLPWGPAGVAMSFSLTGFLFRLPILYYNVGRKGPVSTKDLWSRFLAHLPLFLVVFSVTWMTRQLVAHASPWMQLLVCVPVGSIVGAAFISVSDPQRRVIVYLWQSLLEFRTRRQLG